MNNSARGGYAVRTTAAPLTARFRRHLWRSAGWVPLPPNSRLSRLQRSDARHRPLAQHGHRRQRSGPRVPGSGAPRPATRSAAHEQRSAAGRRHRRAGVVGDRRSRAGAAPEAGSRPTAACAAPARATRLRATPTRSPNTTSGSASSRQLPSAVFFANRPKHLAQDAQQQRNVAVADSHAPHPAADLLLRRDRRDPVRVAGLLRALRAASSPSARHRRLQWGAPSSAAAARSRSGHIRKGKRPLPGPDSSKASPARSEFGAAYGRSSCLRSRARTSPTRTAARRVRRARGARLCPRASGSIGCCSSRFFAPPSCPPRASNRPPPPPRSGNTRAACKTCAPPTAETASRNATS